MMTPDEERDYRARLLVEAARMRAQAYVEEERGRPGEALRLRMNADVAVDIAAGRTKP